MLRPETKTSAFKLSAKGSIKKKCWVGDLACMESNKKLRMTVLSKGHEGNAPSESRPLMGM